MTTWILVNRTSNDRERQASLACTKSCWALRWVCATPIKAVGAVPALSKAESQNCFAQFWWWSSEWARQNPALGCWCPGHLMLARSSSLVLWRKACSQGVSLLDLNHLLNFTNPLPTIASDFTSQAFHSATQRTAWYESKNFAMICFVYNLLSKNLKVFGRDEWDKRMRTTHSHNSQISVWLNAVNKQKQADILAWRVHFPQYPAKAWAL